MASFNSPFYGKQVGSGGNSPAASYPVQPAAIRVIPIEYTIAGTEAANDTINLFRAVPGSKLIPSMSRITCEDPGTALTLDIGDASDSDRYLDGAALTTAHDATFGSLPSVTATAAQYRPVVITDANKDIVATVMTATSLTAGAKILILLAFLDA